MSAEEAQTPTITVEPAEPVPTEPAEDKVTTEAPVTKEAPVTTEAPVTEAPAATEAPVTTEASATPETTVTKETTETKATEGSTTTPNTTSSESGDVRRSRVGFVPQFAEDVPPLKPLKFSHISPAVAGRIHRTKNYTDALVCDQKIAMEQLRYVSERYLIS